MSLKSSKVYHIIDEKDWGEAWRGSICGGLYFYPKGSFYKFPNRPRPIIVNEIPEDRIVRSAS